MEHPDLTPTQLRDIRALLKQELVTFERQIARARAAGPVTLDQTAVGRLSRMDALMNEGLAQGSQARAVEELGLVEDALRRLDDGRYGWCHTCTKPIPVARLLVLPETRVCASCR